MVRAAATGLGGRTRPRTLPRKVRRSGVKPTAPDVRRPKIAFRVSRSFIGHVCRLWGRCPLFLLFTAFFFARVNRFLHFELFFRLPSFRSCISLSSRSKLSEPWDFFRVVFFLLLFGLGVVRARNVGYPMRVTSEMQRTKHWAKTKKKEEKKYERRSSITCRA